MASDAEVRVLLGLLQDKQMKLYEKLRDAAAIAVEGSRAIQHAIDRLERGAEKRKEAEQEFNMVNRGTV